MKKLLFSLAYALLISGAYGQAGFDVDLRQLDAYFARMTEDWGTPGVSIGIVKDGKLIFNGNYGTVETGKSRKPDKNTLYAIASNSKAFTSALIGMLVEEGKMNWDDKATQHVPYFQVYDPWVTANVTIRDLLSHRVGLGTFSGDVIWYKSELPAEEIVRRVKYLPKAFDFRAGYGYSNVMYIVAGEAIRSVTGKSWSVNVKERILEPLGMSRTITSPSLLKEKGNYATPHALVNGKNVPIPWEDWEEIGALGGVISCVEDLSKWMIFNLDHGIWQGDTLISRETRNLVWTPHNNFINDHTRPNEFNRHFRGYGLGWSLSDYRGSLLVQHTGGYDGMTSAVSLVPDHKLGVVVLTNGQKNPIMAATYYALDKFLGVEPKDWSADFLSRANQMEAGDARIANMKAARIPQTQPSLPLENYKGKYWSDIYGAIYVNLENGNLRLTFEHSPRLSATLKHWHHDVWEIDWDELHAWFDFGTVKFTTNNNLEITGMDFDVPNDDIFFHELKPYRVDLGK